MTKLYGAEEVEAFTKFLRGLVEERQRIDRATMPVVTPQIVATPAATPTAVNTASTPAINTTASPAANIVTAPVAPTTIGEQEVVAKLREFVNAKGLAPARAILTEFGANRVADLAADKYAEVYARLASA